MIILELEKPYTKTKISTKLGKTTQIPQFFCYFVYMHPIL